MTLESGVEDDLVDDLESNPGGTPELLIGKKSLPSRTINERRKGDRQSRKNRVAKSEEQRRWGPSKLLELPVQHRRGSPIDPVTCAWRKPDSGIDASWSEYQGWLGVYYSRVLQFIAENPTSPLINNGPFVKRRGAKVPACRKKSVRAACRPCGAPAGHIRPDDTCDAWTCPWCAQARHKAFEAAMSEFATAHPPDRFVAYYAFTITLNVGEHLWQPGYLHDSEQLKAVSRALFSRLWSRPSFKSADGPPTSKLDVAGLRWAFELSEKGALHLHGVRMGSHHRPQDERDVASSICKSAHVKSKVLWRGSRGSIESVAKWAAYMAKGSALQARKFVHPLLAVVADIALAESNRVGGSGSLKSMKKWEESTPHAHNTQEKCPKCGSRDLFREVVERRNGRKTFKVTRSDHPDWAEAEVLRMGGKILVLGKAKQ